MAKVVSIDIGGTNTRVALVNEDYEIIERISFRTDPNNPEVTLKRIGDEINNFNSEVLGLGLSCPGPLDLKKGIVLESPNLPGWHGLHLVERLKELTGLSAYLENDANLAGLAEATIGAGKGYNHVQYLTVSTGLGGGFIVDGEIYIGHRGFAQEIANVILQPGGFSIGNLQAGSLESLCSGTGIVAQAAEKGIEAEHAGIVNDLAVAGNKDAQKIMADTKEYISQAIAGIYAFLDPGIVVLGGSVALKTAGYIEEVENLVKEKVYDVVKENVKLVPASLGDDNGILGGAILVYNKERGNK
ncbi:MAG TPA: ROK family protein [Erysipelothrix sp.]